MTTPLRLRRIAADAEAPLASARLDPGWSTSGQRQNRGSSEQSAHIVWYRMRQVGGSGPGGPPGPLRSCLSSICGGTMNFMLVSSRTVSSPGGARRSVPPPRQVYSVKQNRGSSEHRAQRVWRPGLSCRSSFWGSTMNFMVRFLRTGTVVCPAVDRGRSSSRRTAYSGGLFPLPAYIHKRRPDSNDFPCQISVCTGADVAAAREAAAPGGEIDCARRETDLRRTQNSGFFTG